MTVCAWRSKNISHQLSRSLSERQVEEFCDVVSIEFYNKCFALLVQFPAIHAARIHFQVDISFRWGFVHIIYVLDRGDQCRARLLFVKRRQYRLYISEPFETGVTASTVAFVRFIYTNVHHIYPRSQQPQPATFVQQHVYILR